MKPSAACLSLLAALVLLTPSARAQSAADRATARELGMEGQDALARKDFATAEDRFRRADALYHAPTLLLGYARAEAALGKLVNASEAYNRILREGVGAQTSQAFQGAVDAAKAEIDGVRARIGTVTVTVIGPDNPTVTLDGQPFPAAALGVKRPMDPGEHTVQASADGWDPAEAKFTVGEGAAAATSLTLKRSASVPAATATSAAPSQPSASVTTPETPATSSSSGGGQRVLGWVTLGVGGAALATGAIAGVLAIGKHSTLSSQDGCSNGTCPQTASGDRSSYYTMGTISDVGFIAGAVLAGAGLALVLTSPQSSSSASSGRVTPYVGLGTVGAIGSF